MTNTLTERIVEVFLWAVVALYGVVRLWSGHERWKAARETALHRPETLRAGRPWWLAWRFAVIGGLGLDWRLAFLSFGGRNAPFSESVLRNTGVIAIWVAAVAAVAVLLTRAARWRDLAGFFLFFSVFIYGWLSVDWIVHPR